MNIEDIDAYFNLDNDQRQDFISNKKKCIQKLNTISTHFKHLVNDYGHFFPHITDRRSADIYLDNYISENLHNCIVKNEFKKYMIRKYGEKFYRMNTINKINYESRQN